MDNILYFGCISDKGHFLWESERHYIYVYHSIARQLGVNENIFKFLDGMYCPPHGKQGEYNINIIPPIKIIAWNDYTVDSRPGSNSALIVGGYDLYTIDQIFEEAKKKFPSVMSRQLNLTEFVYKR